MSSELLGFEITFSTFPAKNGVAAILKTEFFNFIGECKDMFQNELHIFLEREVLIYGDPGSKQRNSCNILLINPSRGFQIITMNLGVLEQRPYIQTVPLVHYDDNVFLHGLGLGISLFDLDDATRHGSEDARYVRRP
ncbi:uncharacterized protein LOC135835714 [Planococcus citri]|uniref:uncharacterized protein LOC135835714 n=1 Tax=Planococcus citri TaxID=170843 RepID=UPI0031F7D260